MANAERDFIVEKVKEVLAAPSCCPELKAAAQTYLDVLGTPDEKEAGKLLVAELEEEKFLWLRVKTDRGTVYGICTPLSVAPWRHNHGQRRRSADRPLV